MNEAIESIVLTFKIHSIIHGDGGRHLALPMEGEGQVYLDRREEDSREYFEELLKRMDDKGSFKGFHVSTGRDIGCAAGCAAVGYNVKKGVIRSVNYVSGKKEDSRWSLLEEELTPKQFVEAGRPIEFERRVTVTTNPVDVMTRSINSEGL